jgi:hypothetical protein
MLNKGGPGDVDGTPFYMSAYPEKERGQKKIDRLYEDRRIVLGYLNSVLKPEKDYGVCGSTLYSSMQASCRISISRPRFYELLRELFSSDTKWEDTRLKKTSSGYVLDNCRLIQG